MDEKTLIPLELGDLIEKEIEVRLNKGLPDLRAVKEGIKTALEKWRLNNADKSGG